MQAYKDDIAEIINILRKGGLICYPTDTIWGIGCDPWNPEAMARLESLRGGSPKNGYILLADSLEMVKKYVPKVHPRIETLLSFHTRPVTIIYEKAANLPDYLKGKNNTAAIRIATDDFCCDLTKAFGKPIASTAASRIDMPFPPTFGAISSEILRSVEYVVRFRRDDKTPQQPSPIARLDRHQELEFLRE